MIFQGFNLFDPLTAVVDVEPGADELVFMISGRIVEQGFADRTLDSDEGGRMRAFCAKLAEIGGE